MTVLVSGKSNADLPPIVEAARVSGAARRLRCDRIRIELSNGARVAEFTLDTVDRWVRAHGLQRTPDRRARLGVEYEPLQRIFALGQTKEMT